MVDMLFTDRAILLMGYFLLPWPLFLVISITIMNLTNIQQHYDKLKSKQERHLI